LRRYNQPRYVGFVPSPDRTYLDSNVLPDEADRIASAISKVQLLLPLLGEGGIEAARRLMNAITTLEGEEGPLAARSDAFRAFHLGFKTKEEMDPATGAALPAWSLNEGLNEAYLAGGSAAHLNRMARRKPGLFTQARSGPFDGANLRALLADAMLAVKTSGKRMGDNR
jgi:hypothetical protein